MLSLKKLVQGDVIVIGTDNLSLRLLGEQGIPATVASEIVDAGRFQFLQQIGNCFLLETPAFRFLVIGKILGIIM